METRKLNILMRYPIEWTAYMVMNNFVQNFYDAVGPENFATGFKMDYSGDTLTLEATSGFNKEWLYYLGASTKRDDGKHHAGHFGEGFKMAALVAYRDMKLGITMESQDWRLVVTQADQIINGVSEKVLAYDLFTRPYSDTSKLTLTGVNDEQYKNARGTIKSFYYEGNPRFGDPIIKTEEFAVFKSSSKHTGGVFINLEWRCSLPFPLYFCVHSMDIDKDDRDRITLSNHTMLNHVEADGITSLTMEHIPPKYYSELEQGLLDFFYPENPLLGELIGKGDNYTIYSRSSMAIPCYQFAPKLKGILYINNLARGRLPFPLIVNFKTKCYSDLRSRPTLDELDTYREVYECMEEWTPDQSAVVLRMLQKSWGDVASMEYSDNTNYYYVCQLVRNVSRDNALIETFAEDMKNYCYFEKKTGDTIRNTYINEAQRWWKSNPNGKKIINPIFRLLGAENMVETYLQSNSGSFRKPTKQEQDKYNILSVCITSIIPFLSDEDVPPVEIDSEGKSVYSPLQFASRVYKKKSYGKRYKIDKLILQEQDFDETAFSSTLLKLSEYILQIYGSNRSAKYNAVFTNLGAYLLRRSDLVDMAQRAWEERSKYA